MFTKVTNPGARLLVRAFASTQSRTTNPFTTTTKTRFSRRAFSLRSTIPVSCRGSIVLVLKNK